MKRFMIPGMLVLAFGSIDAMAGCDAPSTQVTQLQDLLGGNTVCATRGSDRWQEEHRVGGQLWDYKLGPSHKVDPSKELGSWSVGGVDDSEVTYNYTAFGSLVSYTFTVFDNGNGTYSFCEGAAENIVATIQGSPQCQ